MEKYKKYKFKTDIEKICKKHNDKVCIFDEINNKKISYKDILENIFHIRTYLQKKKITNNDCIISCIENSAINFQFFLSLMYYGYTYSPLTPDTTIKELNKALKISSNVFVLISDGTNQSLVDYLKKKKIKYTNINQVKFNSNNRIKKIKACNQTGKLVLNSSGTTGEPKKILIEIDKLWTNGKLFSNLYTFINKESIFLNFLPMSYLGGLFNLGLIPISSGSSIVITKQFSGQTLLNFWSLVFKYKINVLWLVPTIVKGLLRFSENFENYKKMFQIPIPKACLLGTAPIDLKTKKKFEKIFGIKIYENYGTSETTFISAELENQSFRSNNTVGKLLPWIKIKKDNKKNFNLKVKNKFQFEGYITEKISNIKNNDYFETGDICQLLKSKNIKIVDRVRRIVKRGGLMIPLKLIENHTNSIDGVEESIAQKIKHEFYGESFEVYYKHFEDMPLTSEEVENIYRENFSKNYWPDKFIEVNKFKKTISQKIKI